MLFNATTFLLNNNTSGAVYIVADLDNIQCAIDELTCMRVCDQCQAAGELTVLPYIPLGGVRRVPCLPFPPTSSLDHEF